MPPQPPELLIELSKLARLADEEPVWPAASWSILERLGGLRWAIPQPFGGDGLAGPPLLERYESLAGTCLTTCFLLSQRDAACRRIIDSGNDKLCGQLLPDLAAGRSFITVGLAQLTTSRQHSASAVTARPDGDHFLVDGAIPWVTGAPRADHLVIGAVLESGQQILAVVPTKLPGLTIGKPMSLMALEGSLTAGVHCHSVRVARDRLLAGPAPKVMQGGRGGTGGLETSCLALGLAGAAVGHLREEAKARPQLGDDADRLEKAHQRLHGELFTLATSTVTTEAAQALRAKANTLVLRATQAALAASKDTGFLREHPAQRWARQALFFLVWSCPWPVTAATMAYLNPADTEGCESI